MVGSGRSGSIASRTFSPPRIPFSQSWTTAVLMTMRQAVSGRGQEEGRSWHLPPAFRLPPPGPQGLSVHPKRLRGGAVPGEVTGSLPAEGGVLGARFLVGREL